MNHQPVLKIYLVAVYYIIVFIHACTYMSVKDTSWLHLYQNNIGIMALVYISFFITFLINLSIIKASSSHNDRFDTHPMLYFSPKDISQLQQKASTTHSHIAAILKDAVHTMLASKEKYLPPSDYEKFGSKWNEIYGNNMPPLAMYCVLYPADKEAYNFALDYMDVMTLLPKWQVISTPTDEVPVAHSLTGYVTTFDFLYPRLDYKRRKAYMERIKKETAEFYRISKFRSWGLFYLQNHVATNYLALLHGSLVVALHDEVGVMWAEHAKIMIEKSMTLLNHIVDGSLDEGVAYGGYTSRSVTQYIYLAKRHFQIDHSKDPWVESHFNFFYNTILPDFQRTIGIADSNSNWFYGPESQLVFLDAFTMRNGHGNWLAKEIRKHRSKDPKSKLMASNSQCWCTLHTEFLWYDASIKPQPPENIGKPHLHVFNDWGVATFSSLSASKYTNTFLGFKSGKLHGRAVFDVVQRGMYKSWVKGWRSFNPGHEHPDQNMFVFEPRGTPFITDALYGPKYSYLNNVLSFSPSSTSECFQPWEGQLGECSKWLQWKKESMATYGGEIISSSFDNDMVHLSGEAVNSYSTAMQLVSVYRSLLLMDEEVLLVLDHIETKESTPLKEVAAFFHNINFEFQKSTYSKLNGAVVKVDNFEMQMFWIDSEGLSVPAEIEHQSHPSEFQKRQTNFVNVTYPLRPGITRIAYALLGPSIKLRRLRFLEENKEGVHLGLTTSKKDYSVSIVTLYDDPIVRYKFLGYPGYASVKVRNGKTVHFGVNTTQYKPFLPLPGNQSFLFNILNLSLVFTGIACVFMYFVKGRLRLKYNRRFKLLLGVIGCLWMLAIFQFIKICKDSVCFVSHAKKNLSPEAEKKLDLSSILIMSLPGTGSELIGWLFYNNHDFVFLNAPSNVVPIPNPTDGTVVDPLLDACQWTKRDIKLTPFMKGWMRSITRNPRNHIMRENIQGRGRRAIHQHLLENNINAKNISFSKDMWMKRKLLVEAGEDINFKEYTEENLIKHIQEFPNARSVIHLKSGSWSLKLPWIHTILKGQVKMIYIIRDPRAWVSNILRSGVSSLYNQWNFPEQLEQLFKLADETCQPAKQYAWEYEKVRRAWTDQKTTPHELLAWVWLAHTEATLRLSGVIPAENFLMVRWEDLVLDSEGTANNMYKYIGYPMPQKVLHQLQQATRSNIVKNRYEGVIRKESVVTWQRELSPEEIHAIEEISSLIVTTHDEHQILW
ncbi:dermatan-sulfate epimerase-like protein [Anneissia japonica]|uniref:dermatan-sulfate epimerase-like protein n=1 Tax=Anneissia japonica TaxID=1529436 RepID=UPI0014256EBB|nr:dermatan-sulfate epimerase-like protein [Anneissia japonica]